MPDIILNKEQKEAVEFENGPLLIIAGAGTGKTKVITERIKHLILNKNIKPDEILALTFTEKAASEMEDRVDRIMPYGYTQMWISTFHAFCDKILRTEAISIGLNPSYKLMTEAESILFIKKNLFKLKLDYYRPLGNPTKFLEALLLHFSRLKDEDIAPLQYIEFAKENSKIKSRFAKAKFAAQTKSKIDEEENKEEKERVLELANAYKAYEDLKIKEGVMDFSDLISKTLFLLRTRRNILKNYQNQFKFIMVDEFQDTNFAQNELAILLSGSKKNITVVADDDQAIYRWRGAALSNVIQFKKNFPGTKIITLTTNFRSTQEILDRSYRLIQNNNPDRLEVMENIDKKLISARKIKGKQIEFIHCKRLDEETEEISRKILELVKGGYEFRDIAILVRANNHAQPITAALHRFKIPYQFLGPGQLFQQEEIKDIIAYLKVLYDLSDSVSLYRVISMDIFGISAREINYILNFSKKKNLSLFESLGKISETFLSDETKMQLQSIQKMILRHLDMVKKETAGQILYYFMVDSGFFKQLIDYKSQKEEKVAQNIAKFFDKIKNYESEKQDAGVYSVVDWIDLMMLMGDSPLAVELDWKDYNAVNILTVHSSKGLEFPVVFLINLVQDRFPTRERKEKIPVPTLLIKELLPQGDYHIEEERRLFYVGMTRAKDRLFLTAANYYGEGRRERKVSPFVKEAYPEGIKNNNEKEEVKQLSLIDVAQMYEERVDYKEEEKPFKISLISFSQLQSFDICPLHFKAKYILGLPTPSSSAISFGISLHNTLNDFYQRIKEGWKPDLEGFMNILKKRWISDGYQNKLHEEESLKKGIKIVENYFKNNFNPKNIPAELELPFSFYLDELKVSGKIDRIDVYPDGKIEIIDYKTGQSNKSAKSSYDFQVGLYGLAASKVKHKLLNIKPEDIILTLFFLETGEKISSTLTVEHLKEIEEKIKEKVAQIEKSNFKCSKNILCADCEYKMLCSA